MAQLTISKIRLQFQGLISRGTYKFASRDFRRRCIISRPRDRIWELCKDLRTVVHCKQVSLIVEAFTTLENSSAYSPSQPRV
jgi:hypothetical protein